MWIAQAAALGQLTLTANFDHGSLKSWSGDLSNIQLVGRDNYYGSGKWRWLYFKASGVAGAQPSFRINGELFAGDATPGPHELRDQEMVYSYDNEHWSFFDNNAKGAVDFTFSNSTPFSQNEVYVAYAIPYSYGRSATHSQHVLDSPWAAPTPSANANGIIGQSPSRVDDLGRLVPALDMYAYRITNPATDSPATAKHKVFLSSGLHAGETLGTYAYEGLVDWLISDDPRAARLRDIAEFDCYPLLNPSGRYAGFSRSTVGNPNRDPNGLWSPSRWSSSSFGCQSGNCDDIRLYGQAMLEDVGATPGGLDAFIDFHSTVPDYTGDGVYEPGDEFPPQDFGYIDIAGGKAEADWWRIFGELEPNHYQWQSGLGTTTTTGFARTQLGAAVDVTIETSFSWERNIDYYHNVGKQLGIAFYQAWVSQVAGDFNGDGVVDAADYTAWRDGLGSQYDAADYDDWKSHFGQTAGNGAGYNLPGDATVPESSSALLMALGGMTFLSRRCCALTRRERRGQVSWG